MAYTPDATDVTQPTADKFVESAAAEFRAIKARLASFFIGSGANTGPAVRQTALSGVQDANGDPAFLAIGTGLAVNLVAAAEPLVLTYADGSNATGDSNIGESLSADVASIVAGLAPSNLNYITKLANSVWGSTLSPLQYGKAFDKTAQMLCRWPGANNAVATTEDFGNVVTFGGVAKLSTATQILGLNTLLLTGAAGVQATIPMTSLGAGSWEIFSSFRSTSLAAVQTLIAAVNAAGFGVQLTVTAAGLLNLYLSSNGTANDLANPAVGTAVIAINTTYFYRITFDAVAGTYRVYLSNNGAAETQDINVASTAKICSLTTLSIGATLAGANGVVGNIGFTGFRKFASFTLAQGTGPIVAPTFTDVRQDFFNIPLMKMYQVTAASAIAGTNPTLTKIDKLYLGEATTAAAAVSSVANYAYKGMYDSGWTATIPSAVQTKSHNIGVVPEVAGFIIENTTTDSGYLVGTRLKNPTVQNAGYDAGSPAVTRIAVFIQPGSTNPFVLAVTPAGTQAALILTSWKWKLTASRGW